MKLYKVTQEPVLTTTEDMESSTWASGVGVTILKRLYFIFYVIAKIINMTAFSPLDTSITSCQYTSLY